eukprot:6127205-Pyramimonas_sp.AAC.1
MQPQPLRRRIGNLKPTGRGDGVLSAFAGMTTRREVISAPPPLWIGHEGLRLAGSEQIRTGGLRRERTTPRATYDLPRPAQNVTPGRLGRRERCPIRRGRRAGRGS